MENSLKSNENDLKMKEMNNNVFQTENENCSDDSDMYNFNSTIIYLIVSCSEDFLFKKEHIDIVSDSKFKKKIKKIKKYNDIKGMNVFFLKIQLYFIEEKKINFKIKIKYYEKSLITKSIYSIEKGQLLFIYNEEYKNEQWYIINEKKIDDFINKKFQISVLKKFLIFKYYLPTIQIPFLLYDTAKVINDSKNLDFEFALIYFMILINGQTVFNELLSGLQDAFKSIIINFKNKENIIVKKYNKNEYNEVMKIIENYDIGIGDKEFLLYYYLFILIYHHYHSSNSFDNKFDEIFEKIPLKTRAVKFIFKHRKNFLKLKASNLQLIFDKVDRDIISFNQILSLSLNFNESLKFICNNKDYIISKKLNITINKFSLPNKFINIKLFIGYIEIVRKLQTNKDQLLKYFSVLINELNETNYEKLILLKEITKNYKDIPFTNEILKQLHLAIHNTGKYVIENDKLESLEIIKFIHEDAILFPNDYENQKDFALLIGHIDLDNVDQRFCRLFNEKYISYKEIYKNNYLLFLNSLIQCVKSFKHLNVLYSLFDIYNNYHPDYLIIEKLVEILYNNILDRKELKINELSRIIGILYILVSENDNIYLKELIEAINLNFTENEIDILSILILNQYGKELNNNTINEIVKTIKNISNENIITYLNQFENKIIKAGFLKKLDSRIVKEDEIINEEMSDNLKLFIQLFFMGYFDEYETYYNNIKYITDTRKTLHHLKENLYNFNFSMKYLTTMNRLNNIIINKYGTMLKFIFFIINFGNQELTDQLYNILNNKIYSCLETYRKVEEIIQIFSYYFSDERVKIITYFRSVKEKMIVSPIYQFPESHQINFFDMHYSEAHEINKMKDSKFFLVIYQIIKNEDEMNEFQSKDVRTIISENLVKNKNSRLFLEAKKKFKNLENLFNIKNEKFVDLVLLEEVLTHIENEEMEKEVNYLKEIFNVSEVFSTKKILEKLYILKDRKNIIDLLNKILLLFKDFQIKYNVKQKYFESVIDQFENNPSLNQLLRENSKLKKINIFRSKSSNAQAIIHQMYNKPELMKFIINKTIHDIHQMGEFIDETEDVFIVISDIDQLESCISFIQELKRKNVDEVEDEVKFLRKFIDLTDHTYFRDIGKNFENSSSKYNEFYELYTYHINSNELNKVHIKRIYYQSTFNIELFYPEYKCSVYYMNNKKLTTKTFDEILDLRDIALLRKKDQSREENDYIKISENFVKFVTDIQEILKSLDCITSKGYYKVLNYRIEVKHGHAYGYSYDKDISIVQSNNQEQNNMKCLQKIITQLNGIIEIQNYNIQTIYESDSIIRMIYGRQFNYLYKKIHSNFVHQNSMESIVDRVFINILKYITKNHNKNSVVPNSIQHNNSISPLIQMYRDVRYYLKEIFIKNSINLREIYKDAQLLDNTKTGIYSHTCPLNDIEKNTVYCSLELTGNFPIAQTVLYCSHMTSEEEIVSFVYKSILCDDSILFIIMKPESLHIERKYLLIELLKKLYFPSPQRMKSTLLFVYSEENKMKEVIMEIEQLPSHKYFDFNINENIDPNYSCSNIGCSSNDNNNNNNNYNNNNNNNNNNNSNNNIDINRNTNNENRRPIHLKLFPGIKIYSSKFSGLGKSTLIKNKFKEKYANQGYEYVYFPLGGDFNKEELVKRLLELTNKRIALHIDLYDTRQIEYMNEFLFSFLILKYYSKNENIFYYGDEIKIKVEIPNSFIDYKQVYPIFGFFKKKHLDYITPLIVHNDVISNVQIVCNYFKNEDQINQRDIHIQGISQNVYPHSVEAVPLPEKECSILIHRNLNIEKPNYYQIESYINIVAEQLRLFTNSYYLNASYLNEIKNFKNHLNNVRSFFIQSLTKNTKHFVTSSYDNILKGQNITHSQQQKKIFDLEKENEQANEILTVKEPFSVDKIKPSMILINEDGHSISEIVTCNPETSEYRQLKAIYNSDLIDERRGVPEYKKLKSKEFLMEVKKVLNLNNPIDEFDTNGSKSLKSLNQIVQSYVFTADNFIKLILISLRLRTQVPVIMMGETGCGKTSLIRIIAELKNITMYTLNIHAGIEDCDIIQFITEKNLLERNYQPIEISSSNQRMENTIWIFLDEINTCNALGLITEIMLKRSCNGQKIKENVKFIAACNPYRLDTRKREIIGLYDETKHLVRKLVYSVHPLPHSLLNFVFDFGTPNVEDIKRYISNMVSQYLQDIIINQSILLKIQDIAEKTIFNAQEFIKNNFEISAVSLREIRRLGILFEWFSKLLKNPYFSEKFNFEDEKVYLYSLNLSIYLCYFIRIYDKEMRQKFLQCMKKSFKENFNFESFPNIIQNIIADAMELERGIAKNSALLENLFAIFVCLNTKIPLFIIGKPGCSKSLSAQLIFKSMNGKDSSSEFFKYFPKVYTKSYQGSLTSHSKGILKVFKKARKSLKDKQYKHDIISTVFFDEMGLAEISKNNPLKVIHSQLEYDENQDKVSFIGISNWALDASKMNRGIHLSIPEPDEKDLTETAFSITESFDIRLKQNYYYYYKYLSSTYYEYKKELQQNFNIFENLSEASHNPVNLNFNNNYINIKEFHGTRDFYHLIKTVSKRLIEYKYPKNGKVIENILKESIERNFGGLSYSIKIFKQILKKYIPNLNESNKYDVMECIVSNIKDSKSRYLLIETKSSISHFLISFLLEKIGKNYVFYYGSHFKDDLSKDYYSAKMLNKIQVTMSQDNVMILKNLTRLYPSLYDLFNQNFRKVGECNYARIALSNSNTQNYFVNNDFRCVILLDKNEINKEDPPFINRFEKHIVSFEYLLNQKQLESSYNINNFIGDLVESRNLRVKINLKNELINCDLEEIQGIIYHFSMKEEYQKYKNINKYNTINDNPYDLMSNLIEFNSDDSTNTTTINEYVLEKIVTTFSQDIIFYTKNSNKNKYEIIQKIYFDKEYEHRNLKCYLENITTNKHIIYTFSNIYDSIYGINDETIQINNIKNNQIFTKATTRTIFINQCNSERVIDDFIFDYYTDNHSNLLIVHYNINDYIHLCHVNYLIENIEVSLKEKYNYKLKVIVFIVHLIRPINNNENYKNSNNKKMYDEDKIHNEYLISHLTEWKQFFIDNLNGMNINIKDVCNASTWELFNNENLINIEKEFKKDLYHAFTIISYNVKINFSSIKKEEYIEKLCSFIIRNEKIINILQDAILKKIRNIQGNIIMKIFTDYTFEDNDIDFISIISKYLKSIYNESLIRTLIQFEEYNILSTKLLNDLDEHTNDELFDNIYQDFIDRFDSSFKKYSKFSQIVKIDLILGISYPCIISIFKKINIYTNTIIGVYLENENKIRRNRFKNIDEYSNNKSFLENNLIIEFEKYYFKKIFINLKYNYEENLKHFFKDFIIYYLSKSNKKFLNRNILEFFHTLYMLFIVKDNHKNEDNEDQFDLFNENYVKFFLFIESYKDYILPLCEFICTVDIYIPGFLNNYISTIYNNVFKINDENISYVNSLFFNIFESIIYCILNINLNNLKDEHFEILINEITLFSHFLMKINVEFYLSLKQYLYILDFVQINEVFNKNGIPLKENLQIYIEILKKENETYVLPEYIPDNTKQNGEILNEEFEFLKKKLYSNENYPLIIVKLLNNKMKISNNEEYRLNLLNILCSNNLFVVKAKIIFETIFNKFNLCPLNLIEDKNISNRVKNKEKTINNKNDEKDTGILFLNEIENEKDNSIVKYLNQTNNICIDETLLSLFDGKFSKYFGFKKLKKDLILNQSLRIMKKCTNYIEAENTKITHNNKLGMLYCISYIKYYCYQLCKIIYMEEKNNDLLNSDIFDFLNEPVSFRKVIKVYILKLLNLIYIGNYNNFHNFIKRKKLFIKDFDFSEKVPYSLDYLFIQNETFDQYKSIREIYILNKMENYKHNDVVLKKLNNENKNIIIFYDLLINKEISNLLTTFNKENYKSFSIFINDLFNKLPLHFSTKNIINQLYGIHSISKKIQYIQNLSPSKFEILLYAYKFAFICSFSKEKSVYSNILSPEINNYLKNIYIPGGEPNDCLLIESGEIIKKYIDQGREGVYMCSCFNWYTVGQCSNPTQISKCSVCGQSIGGNNHRMVNRPGHVKIFKDQNHLNNDRYFVRQDGNIKMLDDLIKDIEKEKNIQIKGFKKVKRDFLIRNNKKVRNISNITYRILSFIFYSCILCNMELKYLDSPFDFYYKDTKTENDPIFSVLMDIWKILKEELLKRNIDNVQCFLNMITPKITSILLDNEKSMENANERNEFEILCHQVIENEISNYNNYYNTFIKNNKEILEIKDDTIKSILQETSNLNNISDDIYPLMNYFYAANYPDYEKFYKQYNFIPNREVQYPVITSYLNESQNEYSMKFLKTFHLINPFVLYMLDKYNNKISRKEAKNRKIKDELEKDNYMKNLFEDFKKGWGKVYNILSNYDCRGRLPDKNITEDDCIAYCLNDNLENGYGKYIATVYKDFITYQNEFLKPLINKNPYKNEYLYPYSNQLEKKIVAQRASKNEIVTLDIKNDMFDSFEDILNAFYYRNYIQANGKINYINYKENIFDLYSIEVELSKILLPEKRQFLNEQNQDFMTYAFEEFNQNESLILDFKEKIETTYTLSKDEKSRLQKLIKKIDGKKFLFNMQSLFLYFTNRKNITGNEFLIDELNNLPKNIIKLDEVFINTIHSCQFNIKLNKLIDCYEIVEYIYFNKILKNVTPKALVNLEDKQIEKLEKHFKKENLLITKKDLKIAVRKFISRFLVSDRLKNFNWNIFLLLRYKNELWNDHIISEECSSVFNEEIEQMENICIRIEQSVDFYRSLK